MKQGPPLSADPAPQVAGRASIEPITYSRYGREKQIVHLGVGNFHRAHQARYLDRLLRQDPGAEWAIVGVGVLPSDSGRIKALESQSYEYTLLERAPSGREHATRIGSITDIIHAPSDPNRAVETIASPKTRLITLTITEGGYPVDDASGSFDPSRGETHRDLMGFGQPRTATGLLVEGLKRRAANGADGVTVLSCDNIVGNGDVARSAVTGYAEAKYPELAGWIAAHVTFPNCMVDRITPATTQSDRQHIVDAYGASDSSPVVCEDYAAWVIEDQFSNGRPDLEQVGVQFVPDVRPYEHAKLRLLNAGHQVLAHTAAQLGYVYVDEAVNDPLVLDLLKSYFAEASATLQVANEIDLFSYQQTLLERFANRAIRDTVERLATDAHDRLTKFLLPVITERLGRRDSARTAIVAVACWLLRYQTEPAQVAPDRQFRTVERAVARSQGDPRLLARSHELFGELTGRSDFAEELARALRIITAADSMREGITRAASND